MQYRGKENTRNGDEMLLKILQKGEELTTSSTAHSTASITGNALSDSAANRTSKQTTPQTKEAAEAKLQAFKVELTESIDVAISENARIFMKTYEIGIERLKDDLKTAISHEGDRMIHALTGGPWSRIQIRYCFTYECKTTG